MDKIQNYENEKDNYTLSPGVNAFLKKTKLKGGWDKDRIYVAKLAALFGLTVMIEKLLESTKLINDDNLIALLIFLGITVTLAVLMYRKIFKK